MGRPESLPEGGARQSSKFFLVSVVLRGPLKFGVPARGWMKVHFRNSRRKVSEKGKYQVEVHTSAVIHAKDELIGMKPGTPQLFF